MRPTNQTKKMIYGLTIIALLGGMIPAASKVNQIKVEKDLGEAAIGQIDTGSFMMKLFLLGGFRGIVANYLWVQAEDYKKNHDWDRLKATVDLITKLQPHFLSIWTFQGWNLAYNVSVEWDAPEDKYEWIKQGIKFVQTGVENNRRSPDLIWDTAWFYYHKLGFSDESIILRRLFRDDDDESFKTYIDPESNQEVVRNDNFQLGYGWFSRAVRLVDEGGTRLGGGTSADIQYIDPTPQRKGRADDIAFRSMPSHAQTHYAAGLEKMSIAGIEATFGEVAKNEWARALREWVQFGSHVFMSHNEVYRDGKLVRDEVRLDDATNRERYKTLPENAQYWTDRWADQMNYRYWKERCQAEMTTEGVSARQLFYEGTKAYKTGDFTLAAEKFRDGLSIWNENLKNFPTYREDDLNKKDTGLVVKRYVRVLRQLGEPVPDTLPFKDLLAAAEADNTVDPFDAIEMLGVGAGAGEPSTAPPPTAGQAAPKPGQ